MACNYCDILNQSIEHNSEEGNPFKQQSDALMSTQCCYSLVCEQCRLKNHEQCQTCNQINTVFTSVPLIILELLDQKTVQAMSHCDRCSIETATTSCQVCDVNLCEHCNSHIHSLGLYSQHQIKMLAPESGILSVGLESGPILSLEKERSLQLMTVNELIERQNSTRLEIESEKRLRVFEIKEHIDRLSRLI